MSSKPFNGRPWTHSKSGARLRGAFSYVKVTKNEDPSKNDRENRMEAKRRIINLIDSGKSLDVAVEIVANQVDIKKNFAYLTKHGVDIKSMLRGLYTSSIAKDRTYDSQLSSRGER